jgi:hypothetical protein
MIICKKGRLLMAYVKEEGEKKKEWLNDKIKQIEEAKRKNETQKFYKNSTFFNKNKPN